MRHADELLKLAKGLRTVPEGQFDMEFWGYRDEPLTSCGTRACAAGWLPKLVPGCGIKHLGNVDGEEFSFIPTYKRFRGFSALHKYFQIPYDLVERLFSFDGYTAMLPTPNNVADEIELTVSTVRDIERQARRDMRVELRKKAKKTIKKRK